MRVSPRLALIYALATFGCAPSAPREEDPGEPEGGTTGEGTGGAKATGGKAGGGTGGKAGSGGSTPEGSGGSAPDPIDAAAPTDGPAGTGGAPGEPTTPVSTDLAKHKFSKSIKLNPAGVAGEVKGYPVLVALGAENFDFAQAQAQGQDVRFATPDGKLLPYSIERWDAGAKKATLWVLVDVKAGAEIVLHFGNPAAESAASSKAVFNQEAGFIGVYHLDEDGNTTPGGYKDSSWNDAHGTGSKLEAGSRMEARAGFGTRFDNPAGGAAGMIKWIEVAGEKATVGFNPDKHPISISAWAFANSWDGYYQTIVSKGDGSYSLQEDYQNKTEVCMSPATGKDHQCALTAGPPLKTWTHYMIMRKTAPSDLALFVNGKRVAGTNAGGKVIDATFGIANQSFRGFERDKKGFNGILDEVRVMSVERNADWATLDVLSQKEGATFLTFGATQTK